MKSSLFHSGTRRLLDLWSALPKAGGLPAWADLNPQAVGGLLCCAFTLKRDDGVLRIGYVGDDIERLYALRLKDADWIGFWRRDDHYAVASEAARPLREARPVVLSASVSGGRELEIALLPFRSRDGRIRRLLGLYQFEDALEPGAAFGMALQNAEPVGPPGRPPLVLAALNGRQVA